VVQPVPIAEHAGVDQVVSVRPASTVMVLRDSASGLQVYVLRRVPEMAFAAGMTVFPGGAVDPADHEPSIGWIGPDAAWWAGRLAVHPAAARALVVAAVRELFEETGVLLAGGPQRNRQAQSSRAAAPGDRPVELTEAVRLDILARRTTLAAALASADLGLRADLLRPWANWITPAGRPRRYDTFFFAAALPDGQEAKQLTSEADLGEWRTPQGLLEEHNAGALRLMPPTVAMLTDLAEFGSVAQALAAERVVTPVDIGRRTAAAAASSDEGKTS
jgi:8-oxo-dGTP pyrophosphatase MutT (NUDIX family)